MHSSIRSCLTVFVICFGATAWAAGPPQVDRLGRDLTPTGGEVAGNKAGSIPAWEGDISPLPGWSQGKVRADYWKYSNEKPLFSIDANNVDKYADKLVPAQVVKIRNTTGYRMDIYPSHRNCSLPDFVQANTKAGAGKSKIGADGWSLRAVRFSEHVVIDRGK